MQSHRSRALIMLAGMALLLPTLASAADWPVWGNGPGRNMVATVTGLPATWDPGQYKGTTEEVDMATTRNIAWVAKLGSQSYGNVTVAGGRVFLGTNNESPRNPKLTGDRSVVMCLDEKTGELLWQLAIPKLGTGKVSDWEYLGICSSPAVDGDRVYVVTNRCEIVCLDVHGMANGNDGPFQDEGPYLAGPGGAAYTPGPTDGDIIWRYDLRDELGVFPHNITSNSILILGDKLVVATSNGVDWTHTTIPNPKAPALIMLDKNTGELLAEEAEGVSARTLHANWASPAGGRVGERDLIFWGGGDGFLYAFDTVPVKGEDGLNLFKQVFRFDCNPPHYRVKNGRPLKYATHDGPSEIIATPVLHNNRVYVAIGQDPEHGEGLGNLVCVDATKTGNLAETGGVIWQYDKIARTISTVAVYENMVFAADYSGFVHCVDANTGKPHWVFDTKSHIWGSPLVTDGKVFVGTEDGDVIMLAAAPTMKELGRVDMRAPVYSTPVAANGALYLGTQTHLYKVAAQ
jgi:outer membrane protein assembly factor BamB